jgi:formate hydrogenlyase subunit 6/NADH:ubiquinone oxidoreductase subunit I
MIIDRKIASAPRTERLAHDVAGLLGPCIGCEGCRGVCAAMIDAMVVPNLILGGESHRAAAV